jgi:aspartyl/glutamyl-tRNA(Asn/Gln) amidotransferase C subunit
MTKITKDVINECATNLMFKITDEELNTTLDEFDSIIKQMSFLANIKDIDKVEPMTFPTDEIHTYLRDDVPCESMPVEEELKMVPSRLGNQVKLPKVVG